MAQFASQLMADILATSAFGQPLAKPSQGATIPLDGKRLLLEKIVAERGEAALLEQQPGIARFRHHPCGIALLNGASPFELLERWQRLERYIHSDHYMELLDAGNNHMVLAHRSRTNQQPSRLEDLAVMGVLKALLIETGVEQLQLEETDNRSWHLHWTTISARQESNESEQDIATLKRVFGQLDTLSSTDQFFSQVIKQIFASQLLNPKVSRLATQLNSSSRTLQRRLKNYGSSFSELVQLCRIARGAELLLARSASVAEIGFITGFADQAHFSRVFKQAIGVTPSNYRQLTQI